MTNTLRTRSFRKENGHCYLIQSLKIFKGSFKLIALGHMRLKKFSVMEQ